MLQLLRTAETLWNSSRILFSRWDLSPSQFNILNLLSDREDGMSQTELSEALLTHRSNVTGLIDRLEERRLVKRQNAPEDRRAYRVVLTADGHTLLQEVLPIYYQASEEVWEVIPARRTKELMTELDTIKDRAETIALKYNQV